MDELAARAEERGPIAYLVTTGDGGPHVVAVTVTWGDDGELAVPAGRHTADNAAARPVVSLVWPAPPGQGYSLIVDGAARVEAGQLAIRPTRAVLHRVPGADPSAPSCVTII
jgi:Pyridoxamine 5'-phosphate oxidase